jgi:hypothetical protein
MKTEICLTAGESKDSAVLEGGPAMIYILSVGFTPGNNHLGRFAR